MAKAVTLYIDDTGIRLLAAGGKRVEKWAYAPLEPGPVRDGVIIDEAEVAARIKELFKAGGVKASKVIAGLSGLHCLCRVVTLPRLSGAMLAEAVRQEAESIMPVPLEELYLSWQVIPTAGEEMRVFLAALPRNAIDALVETLRQAGIKPYLVDLAPLALARAVKETTAITIGVRSAEFDIVIIENGVPYPIRTVSLPGEALPLQEKLPVITEELERTISFYNSTYPEKALEPSTPVFVSGEPADEPELCRSLSGEFGFPVLPLPSPLEGPEDFAPSQYMVNIGLALKKLSPGKGSHPSVVNLNVLPDVYRSKAYPLSGILAVPGIIVAVSLLFYLVTLVQGAAAGTSLLRTELDTANQEIGQRLAEMQAQRQHIAGLETEAGEVEVSRDIFNAVVYYISSGHRRVNGDLEVTMSVLPGTIDLSGITYAGEGLSLTGTAPGETDVLAYASALRGSGEFSRVVISSMTRTGDGMSFGLTLSHGG